jgi:hypothetical protein
VSAGLVVPGIQEVPLGGAGEGIQPADAVASGGGEVEVDGAEGLGAGRGAHAAGDLDTELARPDDLLGLFVAGCDPQVMGEPQVVTVLGEHPRVQGVALLLQIAAAGSVDRDPGGCGVAEPAAVLFQDFRIHGTVPGGAGSVRGLLQFQQRVDSLPRPDHIVRDAGLDDHGQFPQVSAAKIMSRHAVVAHHVNAASHSHQLNEGFIAIDSSEAVAATPPLAGVDDGVTCS